MQIELQEIIDNYSKSIIQSEAEVESKLLVPLIEYLGYPSEFRAEQFPVHGFQGRKKLPPTSADFLLFDDRNFANHKKFTQKNNDWVQNHSLLVVEAKKPGYMPDVMGQAQYYSHWTKSIAYIVTDGEIIKGYYCNPLSSDCAFLDCSVRELPYHDEIKNFSFKRIKTIKEIDFTKEIEKRIDIDQINEKELQTKEVSLPVELIDYMRIVLEDRTNGLDDQKVVETYMLSGYLSSEGRFAEPRYILGIPEATSNPQDTILYIDGGLIPFMKGKIIHYYSILGVNRIVFENENIFIEMLCICDTIIGIKMGFHVQDYCVSTRAYNLRRVKQAFDAERITMRTLNNNNAIDIDFRLFGGKTEHNIAQERKIDYWIERMEQLKIIEEYYEIEFSLRPGLNSTETAELYNAVDTVYDGLAKRRNIFFGNETEKFFSENRPDEMITIDCADFKRIKWKNLIIHNYCFIPNKISIIPKGQNEIDVSVEFIAEKEEGNG